jgi:hypothetical protein
MRAVAEVRINPTGELAEPAPLDEVSAFLSARDPYQPNATDQREMASNFTQLKGQFIIDRGGVVRWTNIECGKEGLSGLGKFPTHDELLAAARVVTD